MCFLGFETETFWRAAYVAECAKALPFKQRDTRFDPGLRLKHDNTKRPTDGVSSIKLKWSKHDESCLK